MSCRRLGLLEHSFTRLIDGIYLVLGPGSTQPHLLNIPTATNAAGLHLNVVVDKPESKGCHSETTISNRFRELQPDTIRPDARSHRSSPPLPSLLPDRCQCSSSVNIHVDRHHQAWPPPSRAAEVWPFPVVFVVSLTDGLLAAWIYWYAGKKM
ncbi:hypothetical protein LZ32DRAFT_208602 [Colletotrichum eremochloae]|nr:hypothetical protein LZ32DRAFT_208602 [Colletotrichum eremochloae]